MAQVQSLAWELPHATGVAKKKKGKGREEGRKGGKKEGKMYKLNFIKIKNFCFIKRKKKF